MSEEGNVVATQVQSSLVASGNTYNPSLVVLRQKGYELWLEKAAGHKEPASLAQATVEHVMPQTLTPEWEQELGIGVAQTVHEQLIDTVGNLTFSAYNAQLSNSSFSTKKDHYRQSNYVLNKYFESIATWDKAAILLRRKAC